MNLNKLFTLVTGIVLSLALVGKLDDLQLWIWKAQAKVIYESHTETWGSPRFWPYKKF